MKKLISKILLAISIFFGIGTGYLAIYSLVEPVGRESRIFLTLVCLAAFGLFLGLYRIIDLLESK